MHPTEKGRVPHLSVDNARTRWLRRHEIEAIKNHVPDWLRDIVDLAVTTGLRLERICELRLADFETDEAGNAYVVIEKDKNRQKLYKMVEGGIRELVERRVASAKFPADYLFPGPGGKGAQTAIKRHLKPAVLKAGIKWGRSKDGVTFHSFRHTMASNALNAGIPEHIVLKMGNWKDRRMLARYAHLGDENLREAEAKIATILRGDLSQCSTAGKSRQQRQERPRRKSRPAKDLMAEPTRLELATSGVTVEKKSKND